jgi:ribokinase
MIVVFGSINLDLIFNVPRIPTAGETILGPTTRIEPGGKGANQALAAARAGGTDTRVVMVGATGADSLAQDATRLLRAANIDLTRVRQSAEPTGCAAITVDPSGANAITVGSGANLAASADQVESALLTSDTTLVLQMEVPAAENIAVIARARAAETRIILNLAPALPLSAIRQVDILVLNEAEAAWLAADQRCIETADALRQQLGVRAVILTRGGDGVMVAEAGQTPWHEPALPIEPVDTTAAGDCFVGVLAEGLDRGLELRQAVSRANRAAALCCTRPGSQSSLPAATEIDPSNLA